MTNRVHAFGDDALGRHDAVGLAQLLRRGEVSERELLDAAIARARKVDPQLHAIEFESFQQPAREERARTAPFAGVPAFIKDNIDVRGMPSRHGSRAVRGAVAKKHSAVTKQLLAQGLVVLGKTKLPEFGFSCSNEFVEGEPTHNPWRLGYSSGASSGGSAALVAAGVVPIAHGNDGGGSIRIPASCCGLVGLKPTRGRLVDGEAASRLPIKIVTEGVLTRSVRDSAHFLAYAEQYYRNRSLAPVGLVEGPNRKRLHIGLVFDSIGGNNSDDETRAVVQRVAHQLEKLGHRVEPFTPPVPETFIEDFKLYWGFMAFMLSKVGFSMFAGFDASRLDGLTLGLAAIYKKNFIRTPVSFARLANSSRLYAREFQRFDAVLSPVMSHTVPKLGYLDPKLPFDTLFSRILKWTAFTPLNNGAGSPAIAVPAGLSREGLPIGVHLSGAHGGERTLLELAYELEAELHAPRIDEPGASAHVSSAS